jgi:hypothetical protein
MSVDLLRSSGTVITGTEQRIHLSLAHRDRCAGNPPSQAFGASGCSQATLVGPVILQVASFTQQLCHAEAGHGDGGGRRGVGDAG